MCILTKQDSRSLTLVPAEVVINNPATPEAAIDNAVTPAVGITANPEVAPRPQQVPSPRRVRGKLKRFYEYFREIWETITSFRKGNPK
jgi:hypothetical protein